MPMTTQDDDDDFKRVQDEKETGPSPNDYKLAKVDLF